MYLIHTIDVMIKKIKPAYDFLIKLILDDLL